MRRPQAGVTLIEVVVAVTLLSLLTVGMAIAIRVGLSAFAKTNTKLMDNRRVAGAQRIVQSELEGLIPAFVACGANPSFPGVRAVLFQGEPANMWLASTFSLQQGWRGQPQILQLFVIPGEEGRGVRLVVNELLYTGARGAGQYCLNAIPAPNSTAKLAQFAPMGAGPASFVLADKLAFCRFAYYTPARLPNQPPTWETTWASKGWPLAVRIEMAPLGTDPSKLQPITVTAPLRIRRDPEKKYEDEY
jgi:prepilin-type N-terminal cleavage/methylation domain-containing protein